MIVVKPSRKRDKKKAERKNDPTRQGYLNVLSKSGVGPGKKSHMADGGDPARTSIDMPMEPNAQEAEAVAAAIGLIPEYDKPAGFTEAYEVHPLSRTTSAEGGVSNDNEMSPQEARVLKSPRLHPDASSPISSDSDDDDANDDEDDEEAHFEVTPFPPRRQPAGSNSQASSG